MPMELLPNQRVTPVPKIPAFNGGDCLAVVDVHGLGELEFDAWEKGPQNVPFDKAYMDAATHRAIVAALARCPAGSRIKLQLKFHYSVKPLHKGKGLPMWQWDQGDSVRSALLAIAAQGGLGIVKVYLSACGSWEKTTIVDAAFRIPGVTHVVTVDDLVILEDGILSGTDENFRPRPIRVVVWTPGPAGTQVANVPPPLAADERFNIRTGAIERRDTGESVCPSITPLSGTCTHVLAAVPTAAHANAIVTMLTPHATGIAYGLASADAIAASARTPCPDPRCTTKSVQGLVVTASSIGTRWSLFHRVFGRGGHVVELTHAWTANMHCT